MEKNSILLSLGNKAYLTLGLIKEKQMMPKQLQNLRKRPSEISYLSEGKKLSSREISKGDEITFFHENDESMSIAVNIVQEDNTVIGDIIKISGEVPGAFLGDTIVLPEDFIYVVVKK